MDDEDLARLLSGRNRPSVLAKEADVHALLERIERERRARRAWVLGGVLAAAAAIVVAYLRMEPAEGTWTARGDKAGPSFLARCDAVRASCRPGDTLTFEIVARAGREYFAAFARRSDGAMLWYLPAPEDRSTHVSRDGSLLETGIKLGPEHVSGEYTIVGVFSFEPLSRESLRNRLGPELRGRTGIEVVEVPLRVEDPP